VATCALGTEEPNITNANTTTNNNTTFIINNVNKNNLSRLVADTTEA
jgi:hypothetical protein